MPRFPVHHASASARLSRKPGLLGMAFRARSPDLPMVPVARYSHAHSPKWRPVSVLDEYVASRPPWPLLYDDLTCSLFCDRWVAREARPISLRQLMVFGRSLTESRLISSANYVRTELPTRQACARYSIVGR
jgi:hypothetical protein